MKKYTIQFSRHAQRLLRTPLLVGAMVFVFTLPTTVFAQSYVPVYDEDLFDAFEQYALDLNDALTGTEGAEDSLRDIIAGADPGGVAKEDCEVLESNDPDVQTLRDWRITPYEKGPWARTIASTTYINEDGEEDTYREELPEEITVEENVSGSLRCLLQELIGYQKISLFVQIQSMLKQYIADAQQKQLSYQLLNQIQAAKLDWGKKGNAVETEGAITTEPVFALSPDRTQFSRNERNVNNIIRQAVAPEGDPTGSLGLANSLKVAAIVDENLKEETDDSRVFAAEKMKSTLTDDGGAFEGTAPADAEAAMDEYMADPNSTKGLGSVNMIFYALNNPQNFELTEVSLLENEARNRLEQDKERFEAELQGSGFQPTRKCSGLPSDPDCDPALMVNVSPAGQNERALTDAIQTGDEQLMNADTLDSSSAESSEDLSVEANTEPLGVYGYDESGLQASGNKVNMLIYELYDSIQMAYFDLSENETNWASAALLSIYDEMNFNDSEPNSVISPPGQGGDDIELEF